MPKIATQRPGYGGLTRGNVNGSHNRETKPLRPDCLADDAVLSEPVWHREFPVIKEKNLEIPYSDRTLPKLTHKTHVIS